MQDLIRPDAANHRPGDAKYVRQLIEASGLSQTDAAFRIGVTPRTMRKWLEGAPIKYPAQYALERLAHGK